MFLLNKCYRKFQTRIESAVYVYLTPLPNPVFPIKYYVIRLFTYFIYVVYIYVKIQKQIFHIRVVLLSNNYPFVLLLLMFLFLLFLLIAENSFILNNTNILCRGVYIHFIHTINTSHHMHVGEIRIGRVISIFLAYILLKINRERGTMTVSSSIHTASLNNLCENVRRDKGECIQRFCSVNHCSGVIIMPDEVSRKMFLLCISNL